MFIDIIKNIYTVDIFTTWIRGVEMCPLYWAFGNRFYCTTYNIIVHNIGIIFNVGKQFLLYDSAFLCQLKVCRQKNDISNHV